MAIGPRIISLLKEIKTIPLFKKYIDGKITIKDAIKVEKDGIKIFGFISIASIDLVDWGTLLKELTEIHGPGVLSTMRMCFEKAGYEDARLLKRILPKEKMHRLLQLWIDLGHIRKILGIEIGKNNDLRKTSLSVALSEIRDEDNKVVIRVQGSLSSRAIKSVTRKTRYPICVHEPAYVAGVLKVITGKEWEVEETKCEGMGDKFCEWVFTKK
ncbi:MAG: 4-vinyl reductase [Candidatus Aenigmatarchaeota archaeon]